MGNRIELTLLTLMLLVLIGCGGGPAPTPDLVATEVAVQRAAAATLTAEAPTPPMPTDTPRPTDTPVLPPTPAAVPSEAAVSTPQPPDATPPPARIEARVIDIIDGHTIEVDIGGQSHRVCYVGITTPETSQRGGKEATEENRRLVEGQIVQLEKGVSETDEQGRLLRYVYLGDLLINAELVRRGYAQAATDPPDVAFADLFGQLEQEAREAARGVWAEPTPIPASPTPPATPTPIPPAPPIPKPAPAWNCSGNRYNCGDFASCEEVMSYWYACPGDPSWLDGDNDGRPCESLCR